MSTFREWFTCGCRYCSGKALDSQLKGSGLKTKPLQIKDNILGQDVNTSHASLRPGG